MEQQNPLDVFLGTTTQDWGGQPPHIPLPTMFEYLLLELHCVMCVGCSMASVCEQTVRDMLSSLGASVLHHGKKDVCVLYVGVGLIP